MDREWTKLTKINLSLRSMVEIKKGEGADKRHKLAVRETLGCFCGYFRFSHIGSQVEASHTSPMPLSL